MVAFAALARPGDRVLIEALAYSGVCHVAERCGVRLHGLAMDDEGLLPEALAAACRADGARLLFVNPTVHNPTTATMSIVRREAIVALADAQEAARSVAAWLRPGDVVLIKASRGVRLEQVAEAVAAHWGKGSHQGAEAADEKETSRT